MRTAFDQTTGQWQIEWPGRVARHDLVYLSPPDDPLTGLLLGNGELGVLCYVSGSKLIFVINRSDLWDDGPPGAFNCAAAEEEERHTTLRHGGRVSIDFKVPLFELIDLSGFQARLSLADARIELSAEGPFGAVSLDAFVSWHQDIFFCEIRQRLSDQTIPLEIRVERFGSRMYHRWYSQVHPDASLGLPGTAALTRGQTGCVTHRLTSGHFALACRVDPVPGDAGGFRPAFKREGQNSVTCCFTGEQADTFRLVCSLTEPVIDQDPAALAEERIGRALAEGREALFTAHSQAWQDLADHLAPLQTIAQPPDVIGTENGQPVLQKGLLRGRPVPGNRIFAAGRSIGENRLMTSFSDLPDEATSVHIHPMWILKSSLRKLVKKGPFTATYGQPDLAAFQYRPPDTNAYTDQIFPGVELSPVYPSGLIGLAGEYAGPEAPLDLRSSLARYTTRAGRFPNPTKNFRFMTLPSDLANGLNEMLLQSHDGIIRVAPAAGSRSACLTLHAVGGFVVSAEISRGNVCWVAVKSRLGGPCRLQNPWKEAYIFRNGSAAGLFAKPRIQIGTQPDDLLMVLPESGLYENWQTETNRCAPNQGPKYCPVGKNMLGLPRLF